MTENQTIAELEARVTQARSALRYVEAQLKQAREEAQHAEIEALGKHLEETEHKLDGLREAGSMALDEVREAIDAVWRGITQWFDKSTANKSDD